VTPLWFGAIGGGAFLVKMILLMWLQLVIRWLLPRFRYDQIQQLCWKILLPAALVNIFVTGAAILIDPSLQLLAWIGVVTIVVIGVLVGVSGRAAPAHHAPAAPGGHGAAHAAGH
jgi:NADH-quinone oxidoreductase subunit H